MIIFDSIVFIKISDWRVQLKTLNNHHPKKTLAYKSLAILL